MHSTQKAASKKSVTLPPTGTGYQLVFWLWVLCYIFNSQEVTFPYPTYRMCCTERMSVNGGKGFFFQVKENSVTNSNTKFHACICCSFWEHLRVGKIVFFQEKQQKHHAKWVLMFSCNLFKNAKQYPGVLFAFCSRDVSLPNVKN